ncbi:glycosyl hydrolase family 18 protein [Flavitalea sp. BT771]|uniref:glycoside hydrolase family 18 protein n=1 Tax=Flavitalea sp. BT771 TaxID=3063329 RepID=UPI0026E3D9C9|nr:glycosyl hydrolase family 18 protein [Flavitalea sp. BT771]MDO6429830.1 glycosyl hydrolase family 18 protein [Flavitalea sp. BT771]MDV6218042.1 glycosyl hydrolase family 18 protein [Flavitalea sp. BT771]
MTNHFRRHFIFTMLSALTTLFTSTVHSQAPSSLEAHSSSLDTSPQPAVIGYYAGRSTALDSFATEKLTHILFSFCHLQGNRLSVSNARDTATILHMVELKRRTPRLKVILSLGGWGGCKTCPLVFATRKGRNEFVRSVKELTDYFHTDGIDLDWEYPALTNVPGYPYSPEDKDHFTLLIKRLRKKLDKTNEISFAAGGFTKYLTTSIDWKKVTPRVNYINLMTYDLVSGYDTISGHHTPLYSTAQQRESTDNAVRYLESIGVPAAKLAIGVAFYARIFEGVDSINNGLYRPCRFKRGVSYRDQATVLSKDSGFVFHWDPVAQAPYMYNARQKLFVTYDDTLSVRLKTRYAMDQHLGGIMFWQLPEDKFTDGLLDVIDNTKKEWLTTSAKDH